MAYFKHLAPFSALLVASFLMMTTMFGMGAAECNGHSVCSPFEMPPCGDSNVCRCIPWGLFVGQCIYPNSLEVAKKIEEHPNLCQSSGECMKKGSGNHCAAFPNPEIQYGWCINNSSDAFNGFLKMMPAQQL
ncbi:unnamed protein product [Cuscuta epithymum]|uniref:Albumin I chain a domain-containing protein n=1 Tax=Cuscuta epithymum TaxID=186058 RepID=A0AAV0EGM1_9ASTE|nr:unnamed protein product [Cuscuta epithymum]